MKRIDKTRLVGRDPGLGRVSFKTGTIPHEKDRQKNRRSKAARKHLREQIDY